MQHGLVASKFESSSETDSDRLAIAGITQKSVRILLVQHVRCAQAKLSPGQRAILIRPVEEKVQRRVGAISLLNGRSLPPLRYCFRIVSERPAQIHGRSLRSLYCCSDGVRGRGAAMTYLSHKTPFHSIEWIAPSKHGIKHLGTDFHFDHWRLPDVAA